MKLLIENFKRYLTEAKKGITFEEALEQVIKSDPEKHKIWTHWEGFPEKEYEYVYYPEAPNPKRSEEIIKYWNGIYKSKEKTDAMRLPPVPSPPFRGPSVGVPNLTQKLTFKEIAKKIVQNPGKTHLVKVGRRWGDYGVNGIKSEEEREKYKDMIFPWTIKGGGYYYTNPDPRRRFEWRSKVPFVKEEGVAYPPFNGVDGLVGMIKALRDTGEIPQEDISSPRAQERALGLEGGRPKASIPSEAHRVASEAVLEAWKIAKNSHQDFWDNVRMVHWITYGGAGATPSLAGIRDYVRRTVETGGIGISAMAYSPGTEMTGTRSAAAAKIKGLEDSEHGFALGIRIEGEPTFATHGDAGTTNPGEIEAGGSFEKMPVVFLKKRKDGQYRPIIVEQETGGHTGNAIMYSEETWRNPDQRGAAIVSHNEVVVQDWKAVSLVVEEAGLTGGSPKTLRRFAMLAKEINIGLEDTMGRSFVAKEGEKEADLESFKSVMSKIEKRLEYHRERMVRSKEEAEEALEKVLEIHDYDLTGPFLKTVVARTEPGSPQRRRVAINLALAYFGRAMDIEGQRIEPPSRLLQKLKGTTGPGIDAAQAVFSALTEFENNKKYAENLIPMLDDMDEKIEAIPDTETTREWRALQQRIKELPPLPEPIDVGSDDLNEIKLMFSKFMKEWL